MKLTKEILAPDGYVVVARIPQVDGSTRCVSVPRGYAREVREALRQDPARIDGLWCPVAVHTVGRVVHARFGGAAERCIGDLPEEEV